MICWGRANSAKLRADLSFTLISRIHPTNSCSHQHLLQFPLVVKTYEAVFENQWNISVIFVNLRVLFNKVREGYCVLGTELHVMPKTTVNL